MDRANHNDHFWGWLFGSLLVAPVLRTIDSGTALCGFVDGGYRRRFRCLSTPSRADYGLRVHRGNRLFPADPKPGFQTGYPYFVFTHPRSRPGIGSLVTLADRD